MGVNKELLVFSPTGLSHDLIATAVAKVAPHIHMRPYTIAACMPQLFLSQIPDFSGCGGSPVSHIYPFFDFSYDSKQLFKHEMKSLEHNYYLNKLNQG